MGLPCVIYVPAVLIATLVSQHALNALRTLPVKLVRSARLVLSAKLAENAVFVRPVPTHSVRLSSAQVVSQEPSPLKVGGYVFVRGFHFFYFFLFPFVLIWSASSTTCLACAAGYSSSFAATVCNACEKGGFSRIYSPNFFNRLLRGGLFNLFTSSNFFFPAESGQPC